MGCSVAHGWRLNVYCAVIHGAVRAMILSHSNMIFNAHTHVTLPQALVNVYPGQHISDGLIYSVGIHPWNAAETSDRQLSQLEEMAVMPCVVAIGETGFDAVRGGDIGLQRNLFERHVRLSESLRKPLVVHCVRAYQQLIAAKHALKPAMPWMVHGFRGKPEVADMLLRAGCYISLGPLFNSRTAQLIPADRLLIETDDDSHADISTVCDAVARERGISPEALADITNANAEALLCRIL